MTGQYPAYLEAGREVVMVDETKLVCSPSKPWDWSACCLCCSASSARKAAFRSGQQDIGRRKAFGSFCGW